MKKYFLLGVMLFSFNNVQAADSTSYTAVDVPWEEPTARRARTADTAGNGVFSGSGSTLTLSNGQTITLYSGGSSEPTYKGCSTGWSNQYHQYIIGSGCHGCIARLGEGGNVQCNNGSWSRI